MADLYCRLAAVTSDAELEAEILATEGTALDSELLAEFTSDAAAETAARPRSLTPSVVGFELVVDGTTVPLGSSTGSWSVRRAIDQRLQTWQVEFILEDEDGALGNPFDHLGPATCKKTVDLYGIYLLSGAAHRVPLIVGGIADVSTRTADAGGYRESLSGVDRGGRYDRKVVTVVLNPGHGLPRSSVVRELASQAGETQQVLEPGRSCTKEVQVVDGEWLGIAAELMETEGRTLVWNRDGYLVNPYVSRPVGETTNWTLEEKDFDASSGMSVDHLADILTDVTLTGSEQIARESGTCDRKETTTEVEVRSEYAPVRQPYLQGSAGYTATAAQPAATYRRVSLVVSEQETKCGSLVWERTRRYGWRNWETLRYEWDAVADEWDRLDCYTPDNADESGPGYAYLDEMWSLVEQSETWYLYRWPGFDLPLGLPTYSGYDIGLLAFWGDPSGSTYPDDQIGQRNPYGTQLASISRVSAPAVVTAALYDRDAATGEEEPIAGVQVTGDGRAGATISTLVRPWRILVSEVTGANSEAEQLLPVSETVTTYLDYERLGYLQEQRSITFGWGVTPVAAGRYIYADGTETNEDEQTWGLVSSERITYLETDEATHTKQTVSYDASGRVVQAVEERGLEGAGPQLARLNLPEVTDADYYEGNEQTTYAQASGRKDTRQIKVQVVAETLEQCHEKGVLKTEMPWAESEDELIEIAERLIAESAAATVRATLAGCNYFVEPGQLHRWRFRPIGLDHDIRITAVTWSGSVGGRTLCNVEGKVYGW